MRVAYFDCIAGISGDMALGALVDAGVDFDQLRGGLAELPLEPFEIELEQTETYGLRAMRVTVHAGTAEVIRTYSNIRALLDQSDLPPDALRTAQRIFRRLAEAEARVHRKEIDLVTFHELGAVDSIVDITGTALALSLLGVQRVFASPVPTGMGMSKSDHGAMPIPAPAVVELLRGAPLYSKGVTQELTTPTGAAILAAISEGYGELPMMRVASVGYGAGTHKLDFPNVLRVLVGDEEPRRAERTVAAPGSTDVVLETNVDDLSPELLDYVLERLLAAGAQDAWLTPIVMKKSRPAVTISVLCSPQGEAASREILFREAGTLGMRSMPVAKQALEREAVEVQTSHGAVTVKVGYLDGAAVSVAPEFEDCARVAREAGVPAREVFEEATRLARAELSSR